MVRKHGRKSVTCHWQHADTAKTLNLNKSERFDGAGNMRELLSNKSSQQQNPIISGYYNRSPCNSFLKDLTTASVTTTCFLTFSSFPKISPTVAYLCCSNDRNACLFYCYAFISSDSRGRLRFLWSRSDFHDVLVRVA